MIRRCECCGVEFEPARDYHRRCWGCWHATDQAGPNDFERRRRVGFGEGIRVGERRVQPVLDRDTIRQALKLVHPDVVRDGQRDIATAVTRKLLELKEAA